MTAPDADGDRVEPAVFGFRIRSAVPLRFLRDGGGGDPLEIVTHDRSDGQADGELLGEWLLQGTTYPATAKLLRVPGGYEYWTSDAGLFRVDEERHRIEIPARGDELLREQRLYGMPLILSFASRGDVSLHAAAVQVGSRAIILAAPSKYGKTTLAFAFQRRGHRVLSEDLICCRPDTAEAIPGPAVLRLRPDVYDRALPEGLSVIAETPDRIFVGFDALRRGSGAPVPIKAIVFLRESDGFQVEPVSAVTALKDLWRLSFRTGTEEWRAASFKNLTALAGSVHVWNAYRPLSLTALDPTVSLIEEIPD